MSPDEDPHPPRRITPFEPAQFAADVSGFPLSVAATVALVQEALDEDVADHDITTVATVLAGHRSRAQLVARASGVVCGVPLALAAFHLVDTEVSIRVDVEDGGVVQPGAEVFFLSGRARGLLTAERTALNFLQRLSGIASLTRQYVQAVAGTSAKIVDTRKTTPGWRALEKYAVRCGGGTNHRFNLADAVLIKDNHIAAVGGDIGETIKRVRAYAPPNTPVQIECDSIDQVRAAVSAKAEGILLDNMRPEQLRDCVAVARGHSIIEASGGVTLSTVRAIAESGVDRISVGALTHSAPALNLALDFE